jgi:hypothetical protein
MFRLELVPESYRMRTKSLESIHERSCEYDDSFVFFCPRLGWVEPGGDCSVHLAQEKTPAMGWERGERDFASTCLAGRGQMGPSVGEDEAKGRGGEDSQGRRDQVRCWYTRALSALSRKHDLYHCAVSVSGLIYPTQTYFHQSSASFGARFNIKMYFHWITPISIRVIYRTMVDANSCKFGPDC